MILCIGSLTPTHITDEAFEELIRITKPGKDPIKLANNPNIKYTPPPPQEKQHSVQELP